MGLGIMQLARGDKPPPRNRQIMLIDQNSPNSPSPLVKKESITPTNTYETINNPSIVPITPKQVPLLNSKGLISSHNIGVLNKNFQNQGQHPSTGIPNSMGSYMPVQQPHHPYAMYPVGMAPKFRIKSSVGYQVMNEPVKLSETTTKLMNRGQQLLNSGYTLMLPGPSLGFKNSWGLLLQEMNWISIDYHEERLWKDKIKDIIKNGVQCTYRLRDKNRDEWSANQAAKLISQWWVHKEGSGYRKGAGNSTCQNEQVKYLVYPLFNQTKTDWVVGEQNPELINFREKMPQSIDIIEEEEHKKNDENETDEDEQLVIPVIKNSVGHYNQLLQKSIEQYMSKIDKSGIEDYPISIRPPDNEMDSVSLILNNDEDYSPLIVNHFILRRKTILASQEYNNLHMQHRQTMSFGTKIIPDKHLPIVENEDKRDKGVTLRPSQSGISDDKPKREYYKTRSLNENEGKIRDESILSYLFQHYGELDPNEIKKMYYSILELYGEGNKLKMKGVSENILALREELQRNGQQALESDVPQKINKFTGLNADDILTDNEPCIKTYSSAHDSTFNMKKIYKQILNYQVEEQIKYNKYEGDYQMSNNKKTEEKINYNARNLFEEYILWYSQRDAKAVNQISFLENDMIYPFLVCVSLNKN